VEGKGKCKEKFVESYTILIQVAKSIAKRFLYKYESCNIGSSMKSKNKLEGATNFKAWKTRIDLILAKNKLLGIVKGKVTEPFDNERKTKYEKDDITARRIIKNSIRDHLIPYVANFNSSKKMYDSQLDYTPSTTLVKQ
jgi:hypothetical protein